MARNANLKISSYLFVDKGDLSDSPRPSVEPREALQWILVFGLSALLIFGVLSFQRNQAIQEPSLSAGPPFRRTSSRPDWVAEIRI